MDEDGDGEITVEEFVKGFHKLKQRQNSDGKTVVTAYVRERIVTKDGGKEAKAEDKPKASNRRKSLKDPAAVKSLFGGKKASTDNAAPPKEEAAKT